jgi:hypothetical protein
MRRHLLGGARGDADSGCAMDKRMDAADSTDAVADADAAAASDGKPNDCCLRCGVPNSGMSRGLALAALAALCAVSSDSVGI